MCVYIYIYIDIDIDIYICIYTHILGVRIVSRPATHNSDYIL